MKLKEWLIIYNALDVALKSIILSKDESDIQILAVKFFQGALHIDYEYRPRGYHGEIYSTARRSRRLNISQTRKICRDSGLSYER